MVVNLITFGAGADKYIEAGQRLLRQADAAGLFDKSVLYLAEDLKADTDFWAQHGAFIEQNKRGYGYWLWKPFLIKREMARMQDGDKLVYLDAGCEIDIRKKDNLVSLLSYVEQDLLIGSRTCIEREFNKIDVILKMNMLEARYLETNQRQPGACIYLVCQKTRDFVNEWYDLCCDYHLLDDSPCTHKNMGGFQDHRHDQAIFSLLTKKRDLFSMKYTIEAGVEISRNCSGVSLFPSS